jgi:hypothetical protein
VAEPAELESVEPSVGVLELVVGGVDVGGVDVGGVEVGGVEVGGVGGVEVAGGVGGVVDGLGVQFGAPPWLKPLSCVPVGTSGPPPPGAVTGVLDGFGFTGGTVAGELLVHGVAAGLLPPGPSRKRLSRPGSFPELAVDPGLWDREPETETLAPGDWCPLP